MVAYSIDFRIAELYPKPLSNTALRYGATGLSQQYFHDKFDRYIVNHNAPLKRDYTMLEAWAITMHPKIQVFRCNGMCIIMKRVDSMCNVFRNYIRK